LINRCRLRRTQGIKIFLFKIFRTKIKKYFLFLKNELIYSVKKSAYETSASQFASAGISAPGGWFYKLTIRLTVVSCFKIQKKRLTGEIGQGSEDCRPTKRFQFFFLSE